MFRIRCTMPARVVRQNITAFWPPPLFPMGCKLAWTQSGNRICSWWIV